MMFTNDGSVGSKNEMSASAKKIYTLLTEIDAICRENNIEYFLAGTLALAAYRGSDKGDDFNVGMVYMTAENLRRFIKVYKNYDREDRTIEWMGNSESFPYVYVRYIDTDSIYYTIQRFSTEKELGMYINIHVIRPKGRRGHYCWIVENAWTDFAYGTPANNRQWGKRPFQAITLACKVFGQKRVARFLVKSLLYLYESKHIGKMCYVKTVRNYPMSLFKESKDVKFYDRYFKVPKNFRKFINTIDVLANENEKHEINHNNIDYFCDPDISYKMLDLSEYRDEVRAIYAKLQIERREAEPLIKASFRAFDIMLRSYYRYYYGFVVFRDMDHMESLYINKQFKELDEILLPYYRLALKYKKKKLSLFIGERVNRLLEARYNANLATLFPNTPKSFKKGLRIYDQKGELAETIWR